MQTPKCTSGLQAIQICINPDCLNQNPFVCNGCKHNKCLQKHKKCKRQEWKEFKQKLQQTRCHTDPAFVNLSAKIYEAILKTMKYLEKEMQNFFMWKMTFGMPTQAKQLFESIASHRQMNWNGRQMYLLLQDVRNHNKITYGEKDEKKLKKEVEQIFTQAEELQKMIKKLYSLQEKQRPQTNLSRYRIRNSSRSKPKRQISPNKQLVIKYDSFKMDSPRTPSTQKLIKKNYLKLKQTHLEDLMRRIGNIRESPETIELKFVQDLLNKNSVKCQQNRMYQKFNLLDVNKLIQLCSGYTSIQIRVTNILLHLDSNQQNKFRWYLIMIQIDVSNPQYIQTQQFAKVMRSQRLKDTKIIILYWPSIVDDHDYFRQMCESLMTLPKLQIFKIISNGQNSKNAFKPLGKKFKSVVQREWWKSQDWKIL